MSPIFMSPEAAAVAMAMVVPEAMAATLLLIMKITYMILSLIRAMRRLSGSH
jgi:hypothetical protein